MTDDIEQRLADIEERAKNATPAAEISMLQNHWIDWRSGEQKYSIAEFDRAEDQEFFYYARTDVPWLIAQLREALERERKLHEALEMLRDHQNGPPLPKYEEGWTKAMKMADEALALQLEARDGK